MQECKSCKVTKDLADFYKHKKVCKACCREKRILRYYDNRELEKAKSRERYRTNPDVKRRYYQKNRESILLKTAKRYRDKQRDREYIESHKNHRVK